MLLYGKKQKSKVEYSAEEVAEAVKKFQENGGLIKKMSDERVPVNNLVNPKRIKNSSGYENLGFSIIKFNEGKIF